MDYEKIDLTNLNGGAPSDLFEEEWKRILKNIADPNTKAEAVREVTLKIKVKPAKDRSTAQTIVLVTSKLAPIQPHESFVTFSTNGSEIGAYVTTLKQNELPLDGGGKILDMQGAK